jgi:hypothetical protein
MLTGNAGRHKIVCQVIKEVVHFWFFSLNHFISVKNGAKISESL